MTSKGINDVTVTFIIKFIKQQYALRGSYIRKNISSGVNNVLLTQQCSPILPFRAPIRKYWIKHVDRTCLNHAYTG
jgi:hypothetical protein